VIQSRTDAGSALITVGRHLLPEYRTGIIGKDGTLENKAYGFRIAGISSFSQVLASGLSPEAKGI